MTIKMNRILLESPVFSVDAALKAAEFGVDRLELCSSFPEGGETPGAGMLSYLKSCVTIPIFVMIRPRGGDFIYSESEISAMEREIEILDGYGADGFVFGILNVDGSVNERQCNRLVYKAGSKPCTFHRAVDESRNPVEAVEPIINCGFKRILTSGGKENVSKGLPVILQMLKKAGSDIIIMPGGGMNPELVKPLKKSSSNLKEVHASCKTWEEIQMESTESTQSKQRVKRLTISRDIVKEFKKAF